MNDFFVIFDRESEVRIANRKWVNARRLAGVRDTKKGKPVGVEVTTGWHNGIIMLDGRIACLVPDKFTFDFIEDKEILFLDDSYFPEKIYEGADLPPT